MSQFPDTNRPDAASRSETDTLLLKLDEAARELRCTRRSLERRIAAHKLAVVHIGRAVRLERAELEAFLDRLRRLEVATPVGDHEDASNRGDGSRHRRARPDAGVGDDSNGRSPHGTTA